MEKRNELLIVNNSSDGVLIDARLLHQQLQITSRFNDWIQRRIDEFGFEKDKDFFATQNLVAKRGGHNRIDYHLTMDMAKELSMLERNTIGRRVRRYFIAVENEARYVSKQAKLLPKMKSMELNGRKLFPYHEMALKLGYKNGGSLYERIYRYPNHFIKVDGIMYVSEDMANLLAMSKNTTNQRLKIRNMQPLLPIDFGQKNGGMLL